LERRPLARRVVAGYQVHAVPEASAPVRFSRALFSDRFLAGTIQLNHGRSSSSALPNYGGAALLRSPNLNTKWCAPNRLLAWQCSRPFQTKWSYSQAQASIEMFPVNAAASA
jgi:hypothetical protein